jgi:hypothetical protein
MQLAQEVAIRSRKDEPQTKQFEVSRRFFEIVHEERKAKSKTGDSRSREALENEISITSFERNDQRPNKQFQIMERWEGVITNIEDKDIHANIEGIFGKEIRRGEIQFSIEDLSSFDWALVGEGVQFYWYIGYKDERNGQRVRASIFRLRRLPLLTETEIQISNEKANTLYEFFKRKTKI